MPLRYYHRPRARDDAHGYSKPSRFLTERLQALCEVGRLGEADDQLTQAARATSTRIEVSLEHLFG